MTLRAAILGTLFVASATHAQRPELIIQNRAPGAHVAFSPDGRLIATTGDEGSTILWEAATGRILRDLPPANQEVRGRDSSGAPTMSGTISGTGNAVVFSPDGRYVAAVPIGLGRAGDDYSWTQPGVPAPAVWEVASGRVLTTAAWERHGSVTRNADVPWSASEIIAWGAVRVDSFAKRLESYTGPVRVISDDATLGIGVAGDRSARSIVLHELPSNREIDRLPQPYANVSGVTLSPDRRWLAVVAHYGWHVEIWNLTRRTRAAVLDSAAVGFVSQVAFSDDGQRLVVAGYAIRVFRTDNWTRLATLGDTTRHDYTVRELAFSRDGRLLAARDDALRVFDVESARLLWERGPLTLHPIDAWVANDRTLVVGRSEFAEYSFSSPTTSVEVWPLDSGAPRQLVDTLRRAVGSLALSPDAKEVAVGLFGDEVVGRYRRAYVGGLSVFDIASGRDVTPPSLAIDEAARGLAYTPDGRFLISVRYEEIPSRRTCAYVECGEDEITNHRVRVHRLNLHTGIDTKLYLLGHDEMEDGGLSVAVSPRGDRVLVGDVPGQMIDLTAVAPMKRFSRTALASSAKPLSEPCGRGEPRVGFVAFSPDGELVARGVERALTIVSSKTGAPLFSRLLTSTPEQIFLRDGRVVADSSQVVILHGRLQPDSSAVLVTCRPGVLGTRVEQLDVKTGARRTLARSDSTIDDALLIRDRVLTRSGNTMTLYDREGTLLAWLLSAGSAWLVIGPDGRYDASPGGEALASWRIETRLLAPSELPSGRRVAGLWPSLLRP